MSEKSPPPRTSFLLTLLVLIACLSIGGGIGMAIAYLLHILKIGGENVEAIVMLAGVLGIGVALFNYFAKRFPTKIGFSR